MEINYKLLGRNIKMQRLRVDLSQAELSEAINVCASYISRIETGRKRASLEILVSIANTLGCSVDDLLTGNLEHNEVAENQQLSNILADCSGAELQMIFDVSDTIKRSVRNLTAKTAHI